MIKCSVYNKDLVDWVRSNQKGISRAELTTRLNKRFDTEFSVKVVSSFCMRCGFKNGVNAGQLKKGGAPWNKGVTGYMGSNETSFKSGESHFRHKAIGSERYCMKSGKRTIVTKVAEPNEWRAKHLVVWESVNGKLPLNHCIKFLDNDRTNCKIDNLICVNRAVSAVLKNSNMSADNPDINHAIILTEKINHTVKNIDRYRSNAQ